MIILVKGSVNAKGVVNQIISFLTGLLVQTESPHNDSFYLSFHPFVQKKVPEEVLPS